ncbi:MAG: hypothetical protein CL799_02695 [Chromatiales bacterium]|nr:hypothetical protein [Chromatiales bacterium]
MKQFIVRTPFSVYMSNLSSRSFPECQATEVWAPNFDEELWNLTNLIQGLGACVIAFDVEFPGFFVDSLRGAPRDRQYQTLRSNVNLLSPIQIGIAVANHEGAVVGLWGFNLHFDLLSDLHTGSAVALLNDAGLDFACHRCSGVRHAIFRRRFAELFLPMLDAAKPRCQIVTFAGAYDYAYLIKLLHGPSLPETVDGFVSLVDGLFPCRCELRDGLPYGSLGSLASEFGVPRSGRAHCAASDALLTLRLYHAAFVTDGCAALLAPHGCVDSFQISSTMFRHPPGLSVAMPYGGLACGSASGLVPAERNISGRSWAMQARWEACRGIGKVVPTHLWCVAAREAAFACVG